MKLRTLFKLTVVPLLVLCLGLHWALLQTIAWTGMLVRYSQDRPLNVAVSDTFDGEHPCPMCKAIEQGRAEEKGQQPLPSSSKLDWAVIWGAPAFHFLEMPQPWNTIRAFPNTRPQAPPIPPPRSYLG